MGAGNSLFRIQQTQRSRLPAQRGQRGEGLTSQSLRSNFDLGQTLAGHPIATSTPAQSPTQSVEVKPGESFMRNAQGGFSPGISQSHASNLGIQQQQRQNLFNNPFQSSMASFGTRGLQAPTLDILQRATNPNDQGFNQQIAALASGQAFQQGQQQLAGQSPTQEKVQALFQFLQGGGNPNNFVATPGGQTALQLFQQANPQLAQSILPQQQFAAPTGPQNFSITAPNIGGALAGPGSTAGPGAAGPGVPGAGAAPGSVGAPTIPGASEFPIVPPAPPAPPTIPTFTPSNPGVPGGSGPNDQFGTVPNVGFPDIPAGTVPGPTGIDTGATAPGSQPGQDIFGKFNDPSSGSRPPGALGDLGGPGTFEMLGPFLSTLGSEALNSFLISPVGQLLRRNISETIGQEGLKPFFGQQQGLADFLAGNLGAERPFNETLEGLVGQLSSGENPDLPFQDIEAGLAKQFSDFLSPEGRPFELQDQEAGLINLLSGGAQGNVSGSAGSFLNDIFDPSTFGDQSQARFDILRNQLERPFEEARERITSDLAKRGVLDSKIAATPLSRLERDRTNAFENLANQLALSSFDAGTQALPTALNFRANQSGQLGNLIGGRRAEDLQKTFGAVDALQNIFNRRQPLEQQRQLGQLSLLSDVLGGERGAAQAQQTQFAQLLNQLTGQANANQLNIADLGQRGQLAGIAQAFGLLPTIFQNDIAQQQLNKLGGADLGSALAGIAQFAPFL